MTVAKKKSKDARDPKGAGSKQAQPEKKSGTGFYMVLGGVALAGIAALLLAGSGGADAPENIPLSLADTEAEASGAVGVAMGAEDAPVTIIEFEDFLCQHCRNFNALTGKLIRRNYATGDDAVLRWVTYDFPLGQASWAPALAARCAEDQGRYWEMHDLLYARTEDWARDSNPNGSFVDLAEEIGMDTGEFRSCLSDRTHLQDIAAARKYGESLGVGGTPTLYLNGRRLTLRTSGDYESLEALILQAAAAAAPASEGEGEGDTDPSGETGR